MKTMKSMAALLLTILVLAVSGFPAMAAGTGTKDDPHIGGNNYSRPDDGSIILHKLDISKFEREKAAALIANGTLTAGSTVTYTGNAPTGASLSGSDVVGYYTTSEDAVTQVPVTLSELASLGNILFHLEQVQLISGRQPGSTNPDDYELAPSPIDSYAKTDASGQIAWTGLAYSYYRITEEPNLTASPVGSGRYIVSLPMVDPEDNSKTVDTVHIYPKNRASEAPVIEKDPPKLGDYNGNILSWTIRSQIPASLKPVQGNQSYVITDRMSQGLSYSGNLRVFYKQGGNDVVLSDGSDYTSNAAAGGTSFTVTLQSGGFTKLGNALAGSSIDLDGNGRAILYVTYDTVVNISQGDLENNTNPDNEVELEFTNEDGTDYDDKPDPIVVDKYAAVQLIKKDGANQSVLLPGAKFKIYTALSGSAVDPLSVLKDSLGNELEFTTDANGEFFYGGLGAGTYYIVETAPPTGYKQLTSYTTIVITDADVENNAVKAATVLNYLDNGFTLPSTGGTGTLLFMIGGIALIAAAGTVLFISLKRKKHPNHTK